MSNTTRDVRVVLRSGGATAWSLSNLPLLVGEPGFDTDNNILKIGNGSTWNNTPSVIQSTSSGNNSGVTGPTGPAGISYNLITGTVYSGPTAGNYSSDSVNLGRNTGLTGQAGNNVAIGTLAGVTQQKVGAIGIGNNAGNLNQSDYSVSLGWNAGYLNQQEKSVAIGFAAGLNSLGSNSIAIGSLAGTNGLQPLGANSIVLNSSGNACAGVAGQTGSFYVTPIRSDTTQTIPLMYNPTTFEIVRGSTSSGIGSGLQGPTGPQGLQGPTGPAGTGSGSGTSVTGDIGPTGLQGPTGATGLQGIQGPTGPAGTGSAGGTGIAGVSGQVYIDQTSQNIYTYNTFDNTTSGSDPQYYYNGFYGGSPYLTRQNIGDGSTDGYLDGTTGVALFGQNPNGICVDSNNIIYLADTNNNVIRKISYGNVTTFSVLAGTNPKPTGIAIDSFGFVYVVCQNTNSVLKLNLSGNVIRTTTGFNNPYGICVDPVGNAYVCDTNNNIIKKIDGSGIVTTFAGTGVTGSADGTLLTAQFDTPIGICIAIDGTLFLTQNGTTAKYVRKIDKSGNVTKYAGNGIPPPVGQGFLNTTPLNASFYDLSNICVDSMNNVYIIDYIGNIVHKINSLGKLNSIKNLRNVSFLITKNIIAVDKLGNLYGASSDNNRQIQIDFISNPIVGGGPIGWNLTGKVSTTPIINLAGATGGFYQVYYNPSTQQFAFSNV